MATSQNLQLTGWHQARNLIATLYIIQRNHGQPSYILREACASAVSLLNSLSNASASSLEMELLQNLRAARASASRCERFLTEAAGEEQMSIEEYHYAMRSLIEVIEAVENCVQTPRAVSVSQ